MADLTLKATEEIVGTGHATKTHTAQRLFLGGATATLRDVDGKILYSLFKEQMSNPSTAADEIALFCKDDGSGNLKLYWRDESDGAVEELGGGDFEVLFQGQVSFNPGYGYANEDVTLTGESDLTTVLEHMTGATCSATNDADRWSVRAKAVDDSGLKLRFTGQASASMTITASYQVLRAASVQRGETSIAVNNSRETATPSISDVGDITTCLLFANGVSLDAAGGGRNLGHEIKFTDTTNLAQAACAVYLNNTLKCPYALGKAA